MTVARAYAELLETLEDLLERFQKVCPDMDGKVDPADAARIRHAEKVIERARQTAGSL
jgi:hypothetical protein